jgi:V-type H+-transporting ATPase subunit a
MRQNHLVEYRAALLKSKEVLGATYYGKVGESNSKAFALNYLVGVVDRTDAIRFKRMVFRATKGNSWVSTSNIEYS